MESTLTWPDWKSYDLAVPYPDEFLSFYGVVRDDAAAVVAGALVMVSACFEGKVESSLGYTFTDRKGTYFISIPKPQDYNLLTGFKVRAAKAATPPEETDYPESFPDKAAGGFEQNIFRQEQAKEKFDREYPEDPMENFLEASLPEGEPFWENSPEESFEDTYNEVQYVPAPVDESIYLEQQLDYTPAGNYSGSVAYVQGGEIRITIFGS